MRPTKLLEERRQSHRIKVCGVAVLRAGNASVICRIADLSTGGIALRAEDARTIASIGIGDLVEIDLQLDPRQTLRVSHEGTVRHIEVAAGRIGVAFTVCPAQLQDPRVIPIGGAPSLRVVEGTGAARRAAFRWWRGRP